MNRLHLSPYAYFPDQYFPLSGAVYRDVPWGSQPMATRETAPADKHSSGTGATANE